VLATSVHRQPQIIYVSPERSDMHVYGLTSFDSEVFVVLPPNNVEVYDSASFTLKHQLSLPGSSSLYEVVACKNDKCLYVSDSSAKKNAPSRAFEQYDNALAHN
jgi:hypothetical protein